jgi:hypothetical protein
VLVVTQVFSFWRSPTLKAWESQWLDFARSAGTRHLQWAVIDSLLAQEIDRLAPMSAERGRVLPPPGTPPSALRDAVRRFWNVDSGDYGRVASDTAWRWLPAYHARADSVVAGTMWRSLGPPGNNTLAATVLAVEAGEAPSARARVRAGLIQMRYRLARFAMERGFVYGLRAPNFLHREVAVATGDTLGQRFAGDFDNRVEQYLIAHRFFIFVPFTATLMADPADPPALALVGDRRQAPSVRRALAKSAVAGQCYNGREMLFGQSPLRRRLIDSARVLVADVPGAVAGIDSAVAAADRTLGGRRAFGLPRRVVTLIRLMGSDTPGCTVI